MVSKFQHTIKKIKLRILSELHHADNTRGRLFAAIRLVFNCFAGIILTIVLATISLKWPIRLLVKRKKSEVKVSFFVEELEGTLRELCVDKKLRKTIVICPYFSKFPNTQLAKMYSEHVYLLLNRSRIVHEIFEYVWPVVNISRSSVKNSSNEFFDCWNSSDPIISFSKTERRVGFELERHLFGKDVKPFVTICLGSAEYRKAVDAAGSDLECALTTVGLSSYKSAVKLLADHGVNVVRFGTMVSELIPTDLGSVMFDATRDRSDFLDVWLNSRCSFILSGVSGGWWLGAPFNRPAVLTNSPYPIGSHGSSDIFIPCMPWLKKEKSFASFLWQFENFEWSTNTFKLGVEYEGIRNQPEQIVDVVNEMLMRSRGEWIDTYEDLKLQARFKKLYEVLSPNFRTPAKIGAKFLREHQHLLPD